MPFASGWWLAWAAGAGAEAVAEPGPDSIIAFINPSLALAFFSRTMSSALKSNVCPLLWTFSTMTSSEMPACNIEMTPSTVKAGFAGAPPVGELVAAVLLDVAALDDGFDAA